MYWSIIQGAALPTAEPTWGKELCTGVSLRTLHLQPLSYGRWMITIGRAGKDGLHIQHILPELSLASSAFVFSDSIITAPFTPLWRPALLFTRPISALRARIPTTCQWMLRHVCYCSIPLLLAPALSVLFSLRPRAFAAVSELSSFCWRARCCV